VVRNQILARHLDSIFDFQFNYSSMQCINYRD